MTAMTHSSNNNTGNSTLPSGRDLLRRFIFDGDEASFAAIVERHSKLVMSVCRRVVGQSPDVDDAFQATFFALSQRPASIFDCLSLSGWLYSVAWRASVRLVRLRKRTMTQPLTDHVSAAEPDPLDVIAQASDLATLDEELNQLPQKYRDVLVMSYFAQQTNQEIADQLNESKGAVDGRIRDARRMLRVRLARRGVEVGVLALATAYVQSAASAASPVLIQKTIALGAPGMFTHELSGLNAAEVAQMKLLTSTGLPLMNKIGLTIAAGLVITTGLWGMTHLAAFQNADGEIDVTAVDAVAGDAAVSDETTVELSGRTEASDSAVRDVDNAPLKDGANGIVLSDGRKIVVEGEAPAAKPRRTLTGAAAEFSKRSERDAERELNEFMQTRVTGDLSFPGEIPLKDILEELSRRMNESQDKTKLLIPDMAALEDASVVLGDVMIKDIEIPNGLMTFGSALNYILSQTDPELTWIAKNELLLITTMAAAESEENMILRSYDISRLREITWPSKPKLALSGGPQGGSGGGAGGGFFSLTPEPQLPGGSSTPAESHEKNTPSSDSEPAITTTESPSGQSMVSWESHIMQAIQDFTMPRARWFRVDGEGGHFNIAGNRLIVLQSRRGHEQVVDVLEQLELAAEDATNEQ